MKSSKCIALHRRLKTSTLLFLAGTMFGSASFGANLTVNTIVDLRATTPNSTSDTVQVLDYYTGTTPTRGRSGGLFRAVHTNDVPRSADDGGKYIAPNSVVAYIWERDFQGEVPNVKMWGAVGNGTTDDTVAIQKAVNATRINRVGAGYSLVGNELLFPGGTYLISDTIIIPGMFLIRGEGANNASTVMMSTNYLNRDIFRTLEADFYIRGWAAGFPAIAHPGSWFYNLMNGVTNNINFNPLRVQDIALSYGSYQSPGQASANATGAAICMTLPLETSEIRNIWTFGGGYGVRVIGPGTPGVRISNSGFFYQAIASVSIEGLKYRTNANSADLYAAYGGPATLSSLAGDSFFPGQAAQNSFILFTNHTPTVSISDISLEGSYGKGAIRCALNPDATGPFGYINIRNGTYNGGWKPSGTVNDFVVLQNGNTNTSFRMPTVSIEGVAMYGIRNVISDEWQPRYIPAPASFNDQLPVRRPLHYTSTTTYWPREKRSLLVYGDTAYYSFIPATTGWKRVLLTYGSDQVSGGRLAINSYSDSSEFSFNMSPFYPQIIVNRTSKNWGGSIPPCISKVRGYTFWQGNGYREAIDIYVDWIMDSGFPPEQQAITLTLPLEGRTEVTSGLSNLIAPIDLEWNSTNATPNPVVSGETYGIGSTGVISLLR